MPDPYAIDEKNNLILLALEIIIKCPKLEKSSEDYYGYYYNNIGNFLSKFIESIYVEKEKVSGNRGVDLVLSPEETYDWLTENGKKQLYFVHVNKKRFGKKRKISKKIFAETMNIFMKEIGVKILETKLIKHGDT